MLITSLTAQTFWTHWTHCTNILNAKENFKNILMQISFINMLLGISTSLKLLLAEYRSL